MSHSGQPSSPAAPPPFFARNVTSGTSRKRTSSGKDTASAPRHLRAGRAKRRTIVKPALRMTANAQRAARIQAERKQCPRRHAPAAQTAPGRNAGPQKQSQTAHAISSSRMASAGRRVPAPPSTTHTAQPASCTCQECTRCGLRTRFAQLRRSFQPWALIGAPSE